MKNMLKVYEIRAAEGREQAARQKLQVEFLELTQKLGQNEVRLRAELERARKIKDANAFVDRLGTTLDFGLVLANAASAVDKSDRAQIESAKTAGELKGLLSEKFNQAASNAGSLKTAIERDNKELGVHTHEAIELFQKEGAPSILIWRVVEPMEYGKELKPNDMR
jgi:hypothetical protein